MDDSKFKEMRKTWKPYNEKPLPHANLSLPIHKSIFRMNNACNSVLSFYNVSCFCAKAQTEMLRWERKRLNSYVKFDVLHNFNELTKSCGGRTAPDGKHTTQARDLVKQHFGKDGMIL